MLKREQTAWLLLMLSFVVSVALAFAFRSQIVTRLHSDSRVSLMAKAQELAKSGDSQRADEVYRELVARYPEREDVLLAYAQYLDVQGRAQEAEAMYRRAVPSGRQRHGSVRRFAAFLEKQDRRDEAVALYEDYVARRPEDLSARLDLGLRLLSRGETDRCVPHLRAAAENAALRAQAESKLGQAYFMRGMMQEAIDTWLRVVAMGDAPENQQFWQNVAESYEKMDALDDAIGAWERYLGHFPNSVTALRRLAKAYQEGGNTQGRQRALLRLAALTPPHLIDRKIGPRVVLLGNSAPERTHGHVRIDVAFRFLANVTRAEACEVRFWLKPQGAAGDEAERAIPSEPRRLGPAPLWRDDSLRQTFALALPADLAEGVYGVEIATGPDFTERIQLCTFSMPWKAAGDGTGGGA